MKPSLLGYRPFKGWDGLAHLFASYGRDCAAIYSICGEAGAGVPWDRNALEYANCLECLAGKEKP